ncbi:MAG: SDR family NAD(P)-dependent oxidoreductase [Crocinitomicaceae bacterium]|nr:SDR family NAD(P)-dependent oxidoreductase [Crocinitomicaceae bacterium]
MYKTIVVVGASRGIGKAIVDVFAKNPENKIVALARNVGKMNSAFSEFDNVSCHALDLGTPNVREVCESIFTDLDSIDILINNAGKLVNKPFTELSREDLEGSYNVNVLGAMQTTQAAVAKMDKAHIVNISSIGGFQGSVKFSGLSAYSTSKAAICSFTELFAEEYKETDIKMNCLCLGAVQTEMLEEAFPGYRAPLTAEQMAEYITHFAETAHQWMNGKIIPVSLSTP